MKAIKGGLSSSNELRDEIYWSEQVELQIKSQLSRQVYCQKKGINYHQFVYWSKKIKREALRELVSVQLKSESSVPVVEMCQKIIGTLNLKNGKQLQIYDEAALLLVLEKVV